MVCKTLLRSWVLLSLSLAPGLAEGGKLTALNEASFDLAVEADGDLLVMFKAPWCQACSKLAHELEKAAESLEGSGVAFASVDAEKYARLAQRFGVTEYPSLRYFKTNEPQVLDASEAGRTWEEISEWVGRVSSAPDRVVHLSDLASVEAFLKEASAEETTGVSVVGHFDSAADSEAFLEVARPFLYPVRFAWTTLPAARPLLGLVNSSGNASSSAVVLYKPFDEKRMVTWLDKQLDRSQGSEADSSQATSTSKVEMAEMLTQVLGVPLGEALRLVPESKQAAKLKAWITSNMLPLFVPYTPNFQSMIFSGPIQRHLIAVFDPEDPSALGEVEAILRGAALEFRGRLLHVLMPASDETREARQFLGLKEGRRLPACVFSDMLADTGESQGRQWVFQEELALTAESLRAFEAARLAEVGALEAVLESSMTGEPDVNEVTKPEAAGSAGKGVDL
mmetsp:Transcript_60363/g.136442  ORF Transcript_60363/g.136442 Transcript_60363/m.136442 type:complete len:452 (+) Transcript_60363:86-1441(+)|eukprot:CAMPEP_0172620860 /NCGR_PEP_ID=MMETSP1068-20121228/106894_1 /TAXON_ID=35684 /ORGANISM="Pseudopedinella elastica, Strain CCMP716" /LENGTH=451 /DNA_ID=CAMNT_0013428315 /DNA_START=57 /DNA_END=1412 /DNA_ORIENTATION=-